MNKRYRGLVLGLLLIPMHLFAQTDPLEQVLELSIAELLNVEVSTASKRSESVQDAPSIMTVISKEAINQFAADNLGEVLNKMVSMQLLTANIFTNNIINTRGQSFTPYNNHVLFLINGRPIRDPISGGLNATLLNSFPISVVESIEIIRGPESVLYGSCAYSGVVNIITTSDKGKDVEGSFSFDYGNLNSRNTRFSTTITNPELMAQIGFNNYNTDGMTYEFTDYLGVDSSANFWEKGYGVFAHVNYKDISFTTSVLEYNPYALGGINNAWSADWGDNQRNLTFFNDISFKNTLSEIIKLNTSLTYNRNVMHSDLGIVLEAIDRMIESYVLIQPISALNITAGGTIGNLKHTGDILKDGKSLYGSLYAQGDYAFNDKIKLIAGLQWNKVDGIKNSLSPRLGIVGSFNPYMGFKLLYGKAFRKGYPLETSFNIPQLIGNPNIEAEFINTIEAQVNYYRSRLQFASTFYYSYMHNLIGRYPYNDIGYLRYENGEEQNFAGWEFELRYTLDRNFTFIGNLNYQQNWNNQNEKHVSLHPNIMAKAGIIYNQRRFHVSLFNSYFGAPHPVNIVNPNVAIVNKEAKAYSLLSAKISYDFLIRDGNKISMYFKGTNLLNQDVRYPEYTSKGVNTLIPLSNTAQYLLGVHATF